MSAEIQTGLFILTAEVAGITTLAALAAGIVAWVRRKGRMKAAEALRASADRLPGEGEIVQKEKALLGEFARAYLTRDADVLASLPAQLLALRQMHEDIQVSEEAADTQQTEALQAEKEAFRARAEALEKQQALTAQQLEGTLSTINTLVQEYGRGRGQEVTPTAESMLQALLQIQGQSAEMPDQDAIEISSPGVETAVEAQVAPVTEEAATREPVSEQGSDAGSEAMDLAVEDELEAVPPAEPEVEATAQEAAASGEAEKAAAAAVSNDDVDALLMDVLGEGASAEPKASPPEKSEKAAAEAEAVKAPDVPAAPKAQVAPKDEAMDLSVPVEKAQGKPPAPAHDDLDDLDIDALLDAEMGRQATLLTPAPASGEDLDLSRVDTPPGK